MMFDLEATRTRARDRRRSDAADAGACLAAAVGAARRDRHRQAREPHADRRLQGARRAGLCRAAEARAVRHAGLISATRGNHGQSLAFAASRYGVPVTIYVPHGNSVEKNRAMRAFGANLVEHGEDFQSAREEAERRAEARRPRNGAVVPSRPRAGRRDLCARTAARSARSRRALCADRAGLRHLRLHPGARSARA